MTVRELQNALAKCDPDATVICREESESSVRTLFTRGASESPAEWRRDERGEVQIRFDRTHSDRKVVVIDVSQDD